MKLTTEIENLDRYPFHMPGHKRSNEFGIAGSKLDITEIEGFDNLHNASGLIFSIEDRLSKIYKSKKSFMMTNGSTGGILSAIFAVCKPNDSIIIARNCHKSVYNACMLRELKVSYIEPSFDCVNGYYKRVNQEDVNKAIQNHPDAKAIVITSPTYEGMISNVKADIPLIIDAAHGAHLGIGLFPAYPNADIVISSLHKTLPALTQCAVANIYNEKLIASFKQYIDIFETSSPSYLLMSSVEKCCDYIESKPNSFNDYIKLIYDFRDIDLHSLRLEYTDDISKIVISTANAGISGAELAHILRSKYKLEVEMASLNYIIAMTSVADKKEAFDALKNAIIEIDTALLNTNALGMSKPPIPSVEQKISISDESVSVELSEAINKTANEFVYAYPPDIPIIVPNETISKDAVIYIKQLIKAGVNIVSDSSLMPNKILTKE